jgi:hypothetical protein
MPVSTARNRDLSSRILCWLLAASFSSLFVASTAIAQQHCSELLHQGIFDVRNSTSSSVDVSSYSRWFCDQRFQSQGEAQNFGASFEQPFRRFAANFSRENWASEVRSFCENVNDTRYLEQHASSYVREVSPTLMAAFRECTGRAGLHVWLERTEDPMTVYFAARFNPDSAREVASITAFDPGSNMSCTPDPESWTEMANQTKYARCSRQNRGSVAMVVDANHDPQGGGRLTLPAIPEPPPPPCPTENEARCEAVVYSSSRGSGSPDRCPGIVVHAPEHRYPDSVYYIQVTADGGTPVRCGGSAPNYVGIGQPCAFTFQGKRWTATLERVRDLGGNTFDSAVRLKRDCSGGRP